MTGRDAGIADRAGTRGLPNSSTHADGGGQCNESREQPARAAMGALRDPAPDPRPRIVWVAWIRRRIIGGATKIRLARTGPTSGGAHVV